MFLSDYTPYVLIVEDEEDNRELLSVIPSEEGYQVQTAQDGLAAISMVEQIKPDLILMDVNMPRMDGFEACRELKKRHPDFDIPIVFLTGQNSMESIVHGFVLGARDYLTKPFNIEDASPCVKMAQEMIFRTKIMGLDIRSSSAPANAPSATSAASAASTVWIIPS